MNSASHSIRSNTRRDTRSPIWRTLVLFGLSLVLLPCAIVAAANDACSDRGIIPNIDYRTRHAVREKDGFWQPCGEYDQINPPKVFLQETSSSTQSYWKEFGPEIDMSGSGHQVLRVLREVSGALYVQFEADISVYRNDGTITDCSATSSGAGLTPPLEINGPAHQSDPDCWNVWTASINNYFLPWMLFSDSCEPGSITHKTYMGSVDLQSLQGLFELEVTVSDEYTREVLIRFTIEDVAELEYVGGWQLFGSAFTRLGPDTTYFYPEWKADVQKMQYRLSFDSLKEVVYLVEWEEVTLWDEGGVSVAKLSERVTGTGGEVFTRIYERLPPTQPGVIFVANSTARPVSTHPATPPTQAGTGCLGCGENQGELGRGSLGENGVMLYLNLGTGHLGQPVGGLMLAEGLPSWILAHPAGLRFIGSDAEVDLLSTDALSLRQVRSPQGLADISPHQTNEHAYQIEFYFSSQVQTNQGGLYTTTNSPFVTWIIENPDGETSTNRLHITESRPGLTNLFQYTWDTDSRAWWLVRGEGLRQDETEFVWDDGAKTLTRTHWIRNGADQPVSKSTQKRKVFREDNFSSPELSRYAAPIIEEAFDDEPTSYLYDPTTFLNDMRMPLKWMIQPTGYWEYYEYDAIDSRRLARKVSQYLNAATNAVPNNLGLCRVIDYEYNAPTATPGSGDTGALEPFSPRRTIEKVLDQEISRSYLVLLPNERRDIRCQTPLAEWNDPDNLVTTNRYYPSGPFHGRLRSVDHPDGTRQVYFYSTNSTHFTTVVLSGEAHPSNATNIVSGTSTTTIIDLAGAPVSHVTADFSLPIVLSSQTYSEHDSFGRPQRVTYLDGTFTEAVYACCGLDESVDRDGASTFYIYDPLGRQTSTMRHGVTTANILDPAGRVLMTQRIGTDLSTDALSWTAYDLGGRIVSQTNALGGVTTFSESKDGQGQTVRTTTFHDGGTRIETFFKDGQLRTVLGTAVQPLEYRYGIASDGGVQRLYSAEIRLTATGGTNEWTRTYFDMLGRPYKTVHAGAGNPYQQSFYNKAGQLWKTRDPDNVITLYRYNARGEQEYVVQAISATARNFTNYNTFVNEFASLQSGTDRITRTISDVLYNATHGFNVRRLRTYVWPTDSQNVSLLVSTVETSTDGLRSWHTIYRDPSTPVVTRSVTTYSGNGSRTVTRTAPDGSYAMHAFSYGRPSTVIRRSSTNSQIGRTNYGYDTHGRQATITDFRNGTTTHTFNAADLVATITTPPPGTGGPAQTTETHYNQMLQAIRTIQPDGSTLTNEFHLTGLLKRTSGTRVYPVGYGYDAQGRMKTMTNWSGFAGGSGARVTTWNYDPARGWLENKRYPDSTGPNYTYTDAGRLKTRLWARGNPRVTTTYGYNTIGDLSSVTYANDPAGTPNLGYTYDRRGRQLTAVQGAMTTTMYYNDANLLTGETYSGATAILKDMSVTNVFDAYLRRTGLTGRKDGTTLVSGTYGYDTAGRLSTVTDGTFNSTYTYLANSPLVGQITHRQSSTVRMTETRQYDLLNRLTSITSTPASAAELPAGFSYQYNQANQRVRTTLADGSFWVYEYDSLGQVTSGKRFWSDGTPVPGQQFEYGFDDIGNRTETRAGGDSAGTGLRSAGYTNNLLNQITGRGVSGAFDVVGIANARETVSVNNAGVDYRRGEYFQKLIQVNNTGDLVWTNVPVTTSGGGSLAGKVYVPKTAEVYQYDLDGNLTQDGRWTYTWDAENRLIQITPLAAMPEADKRRGNYAYDHQGRRIWKRVDYRVSGNWTTFTERKFLYDRWNLMVELFTNDTAVKRFHWGLDLSGSEHGVGGVGGLLKVWDHYTGNHCFVGYDGNGNVMALVLGHGTPAGTYRARFEYGPFGEPIRSSGTTTLGATDARGMPFRFSTKYTDWESDLVYYGYRYYTPSTGRWVNRDPIGEYGGYNLCAFVKNSPTNRRDYLGLKGDACDTKCGPSVTREVQRVLQSVKNLFGSLSGEEKLLACNRLHGYEGPDRSRWWDFYGRITIAQNAWDINELAYHTEEVYERGGQTFIQPFGEPEHCKFTVAYQGKCYYAGQVNFILFGYAHHLCNESVGRLPEHRGEWTMNQALWYVDRWKEFRHSQRGDYEAALPYIEQARAFTRHGFDPAQRPDGTACHDCRIQAGLAVDAAFGWTWYPFKERTFWPEQ